MSELRSVYVDNNATTRPHPEVVEAMNEIYRDLWGNPSSAHHYGRPIKAKIAEAREVVAAAIGAQPEEVYFTSGGTESDNLAIKGATWANRVHGSGHIITSTIEHPAVLETVKYLSKNGFDITRVDVDGAALVHPSAVSEAFRENTILVTIMSANNEVGVIQPIAEIAEITRAKGALFHTDAVQSFLKIPTDVKEMDVDLLSVSGHKVHGPKGVGALYVRKGVKLHTLNHGGHHERGLRAGTENVAGIIGFAKAVEIGLARMAQTAEHTKKLRDDLQARILAEIPVVRVNGSQEKRLPGTLNMSFECVEGEALLINLDMRGIALSTGSACSSGSLDPSHVLMAMGIPHEIIHGSLRFSFGLENTADDVDYIMTHLPQVIASVRRISPLWDNERNVPITLEEAQANASTA